MIRRIFKSASYLACVILGLAACEADPRTSFVDDDGAETCWRETSDAGTETSEGVPDFRLVGEGTLDARGRTEPFEVELTPGVEGLTLRITDPTGSPACVQLDSVESLAGEPWISPDCVSCPQRVSIGIGHGLYVLPSSDPPPPPASRLRLVAAARECSTSRSSPKAGEIPASLRIEALQKPAPEPERSGVISLGLVFTAGSVLADDSVAEDVIPEALRILNAMLAPGALEVEVVRTRRIEASGDLELTRDDPAALTDLAEVLRLPERCAVPSDDGWVPVVFAGCIRVWDSIQPAPHEPDGYTPGIPGGFPPAGLAHGIYIRGQSCRAGTATAWPPSLLAKLIAHELGHYLGLNHTVEDDGSMDSLADTGSDDNIMYPRPTTATARGFSPSQFRIMRRHPAVRWR